MNNINRKGRLTVLISQIDWELQKRRPFVVADPMEPDSLLYLSDKEYQVLLRTCISNNETLVVVARPGSMPPTEDSSK